jgi:hypothetical protein
MGFIHCSATGDSYTALATRHAFTAPQQGVQSLLRNRWWSHCSCNRWCSHCSATWGALNSPATGGAVTAPATGGN